MDNFSGAASTGDRIRTAFGPILVGLIGGALIGLSVFTDAIWTNVAETEAHFPRRSHAPVNPNEFTLGIVGFFLRYGTPLAIGLVTAWFVRTRDRLEDIQAGTMAGITASFVACVGLIGWQTTIAHTIVPSLMDWMVITSAANPSDAPKDPSRSYPPSLAEAYPGIDKVPARERGDALVGKLSSDQVRRTQKGLLAGGILSLLMVGGVTLVGTMAGGRLRREPVSAGRSVGLFAEMMIPTTITLTCFGRVLGFDFSANEWTFNAVIGLSWGVWFTMTLVGASLIQRASIGLFWLLLLLMHDRLEVPTLLTLATFMGIALASMRTYGQSKNDETLKLAIS